MLPKRNAVPVILGLVVGLGVSAFVPKPADAQGCGWCDEWRVWWTAWLAKKHNFPGGDDLCLWPPGENCARCGTGLGCHVEEDWGSCHIECGPDGEPTALRDAVDRIRTLLDAGDAVVAAAMVLTDRTDLTIEYRPAAGRINFKLPCDPDVPAATVAVLPGVRPQLEAALAASSSSPARARRADDVLSPPL